MATIRLKRRPLASGVGAPATLATTEAAYNESEDTLYIGVGNDGSGVATSIKAIAGSGAVVDKTSAQTVGGEKTFTTTPIVGTMATSDNSTKAASTAFVKAQGYLTSAPATTLTGDVTGTGAGTIPTTLAAVGTAGTYTKVTTDSKGRVTAGTTLSAADIPTLTASKISDFDTQVRTSRLDQMAAPTAAVSLNNQKITGLATPTADTDAATKGYADSIAQGLDSKESVRAATTANITLTGAQTVDGVALVAGNRVLVKDQTTASTNGIYVVAAGAWTRSTDADSSAEVTAGMYCFVEEGTTNADSGWILTTNGAITLGTTSLSFTQFSGAGQVTAGTGLIKTGNTLALDGQALALHNLGTNGIIVRTAAGTVAARTLTGIAARTTVTNGDGVAGNPTIDIAATYAGQTSITTLGTVSTGTWGATVIGLAFGGTGRNLSGDADGSIYKKSGTQLVVATAGTDYLNSASIIDGGSF